MGGRGRGRKNADSTPQSPQHRAISSPTSLPCMSFMQYPESEGRMSRGRGGRQGCMRSNSARRALVQTAAFGSNWEGLLATSAFACGSYDSSRAAVLHDGAGCRTANPYSNRGTAAVAQHDRQLLLISKDGKMPHVWELRIHPGKTFSQEWLAAVDRWCSNMILGQQQPPSGAYPQPPPPPCRNGPTNSATAVAAAATSSGPPPVPEEPQDIDNDDYGYEPSSDDFDKSAGHGPDSGAGSSGGSSSSGSNIAEDDMYDMVSQLRNVRLSGAGNTDVDNVSVAATAGSSVGGSEQFSGARKHKGNKLAAACTAAANVGDPSTAGLREPGSAAAAESSSSIESSSGLWATDSDAGTPGEHDPYTGVAVDTESDGDAVETALTAAEESDLLGQPQLQSQPQQQLDFQQQQQRQPAGVGDEQQGRQRKQRRGERKRERWQQRLLVSLRLEKQGITDKEAELLAQWYTTSGVAEHVRIAKIWLFDNGLGDKGAAALAPLIGPDLCELHLSHNAIGVAGACAVLAAVPLQRAPGLKPLWLRLEWNQVDDAALRKYIQQECSARGLCVDIAKELPVQQRRTDSRGRELNLSWSIPWQSCQVQMPWLSCQRSAPAEATVLKAAKQAWSRAQQPPPPSARYCPDGYWQQQQQQQASGHLGFGGIGGPSIGAFDSSVPYVDTSMPSQQPAPPLPPPPRPAAAVPEAASNAANQAAGKALSSSLNAAGIAAAGVGGAESLVDDSSAASIAGTGGSNLYQDGPLMVFLDTSALLSMLGCGSGVTASTCCTFKLLQSLANSGRFGRSLRPEEQTFVVLADTVVKQLDSLKSAETGVGGPVRRFLDKGLDELGPKGLDFLTVLAAHEGEGLVVDRQAAVAGSRSPLFSGPTGQRSDLSIIEVALFFRTELLAAAAAAGGQVPSSNGATEAADGSNTGQAGPTGEAQPVILVTNDNGQLQLAKSHGLPAFKLAGASEFESGISEVIKSGGELTSSVLRSLMAPAATAGLGAIAGRSLQDDFDGAVSCLKGLLEAYEDLSGLLGRISLTLASSNAATAADGSAAGSRGEAQQMLHEVGQLLQQHQHPQPFEDNSSSNSVNGVAALLAGSNIAGDTGEQANNVSVSVFEASLSNIAAVEHSLSGWEARIKSRHTPSRVVKWASRGLAALSPAT